MFTLKGNITSSYDSICIPPNTVEPYIVQSQMLRCEDLHKNPTIKNTTIEIPTDFGKSIKKPTLKISGGIKNPT